MYRRLSLSLFLIFRERRRERAKFREGGGIGSIVKRLHGVQFLDAYCHALLSAESTAITASRGGDRQEKNEAGRKAATGGYNRLVNLPTIAVHCLRKLTADDRTAVEISRDFASFTLADSPDAGF